MFQPFQTHNQPFSLKILHFSPFFSTRFHCSCSKCTTTTAQFPFYNCKLHFYNCTNCHQLHVKIFPENNVDTSHIICDYVKKFEFNIFAVMHLTKIIYFTSLYTIVHATE